MPREMAPVEPSAFAAELITRLEKLKREQDTLSCLEERLQQIQEVRNEQGRTMDRSLISIVILAVLISPHCEHPSRSQTK